MKYLRDWDQYMLIQLAEDKVDFYLVEIVADIILNGASVWDSISCSSVRPIKKL